MLTHSTQSPSGAALRKLSILAVLLLAMLEPTFGTEPPAKPNVVLILADDLGYADIGIHGSTDIRTPHIDRLARSGVRMTSGYSTHPYCSPMRAALMAGRYQHRFGYERNIAYDPQNNHMGLPTTERTVASRLRDAGYATAAIGKWHLGAGRPFHPTRRGFDHFFGFLGGGHDYFSVDLRRPMGEGYFQPLERNGKPVDVEGYLTTQLSREAVTFIRAQSKSPFFIYLAYNAPHTPMQAPEDYLERFKSIKDTKRRTYAAMVSALDDGIGMVVAALEELQIREKTLVFFLSDNGGPERSNASSNDPLRGQKGDVFEGGIRVPFIASWPGTLPAGRSYDQPVSSLDTVRTALALGGADPGPSSKLEGVNLIPHLTGKAEGAPHEALFWRKEGGESWAIRSAAEKLLLTAASGSVALYDLEADIAEQKDLASTRESRVVALRALFEAWNRNNIPPFFPGFRQYHPLKDRFYRELSKKPGSRQ